MASTRWWARHGDLLAAAAVLTFSSTLYIATLAPTVTSEDSGELIAAAHCFGIPHPPGYPLWTLLCGMFLRLCPLGEIAYRANLFSAVCSAASGVPLLLALRRAGLRRRSAVGATWVWASSGTLWSQSVITEVYGLHALCTTTLIWTVVSWQDTRRPMWLWSAALVFGLGMSNHHTIGFVALALGLWSGCGLVSRHGRPQLGRRWSLRQTAGVGVGVAVGLLPYLYLPVRATARTPMNWGNPQTLAAFWDHVTRAQYGSTAPLEPSVKRSLSRSVDQLAYAAGVLADDVTPPLALGGLAGLAIMFRRRHPWTGLVLLLLASCGGLFLLISNIDLDRTFRFAMRVFFIPLSAALVIALAFLLDAAWARLGEHRSPWLRATAGGALLASAVLPVFGNLERSNYRNYWYAYDHARSLLASMRHDAVVFPSGDHTTFPLIYAVLVEGLAPGVTIADKYGYVDDAVVEDLAAGVGRPPPADRDQRAAWIIHNARRPVYYTVKSAPFIAGATLVPVGLVYHLLPRGHAVDPAAPWSGIAYRNLTGTPSVADLGAAHIQSDYYFFRALERLRLGLREAALADFERSAKLLWGVKECPNNIGSALAEHGLAAEAIRFLEQAREMDPHYLTPRRNLVRIYREQGRLDKVRELVSEITAIEAAGE